MERELMSPKEVGRPFKVRVSARKYTGWRDHPWYPKMGGLLGLSMGVDRTRVIKTKVSLNIYLSYGLRTDLEKLLKSEGFEPKRNIRVTGYNEWVIEEVEKFGSYDKDELKLSVKNYVMGTKAETIEMIKNEIKEYQVYAHNPQIWDDFYVDVEENTSSEVTK